MVIQEQNPLIKVNIKNNFHFKGGVVNALKLRFMCMTFVCASPCKIIFWICNVFKVSSLTR